MKRKYNGRVTVYLAPDCLSRFYYFRILFHSSTSEFFFTRSFIFFLFTIDIVTHFAFCITNTFLFRIIVRDHRRDSSSLSVARFARSGRENHCDKERERNTMKK